MSKPKVCTVCGHVGESKRVTRGSFLIELVLWLCFLVPGILYSLWRLTTRHDACQACGAATMVPADSPIGAKLMRDLGVTAPLAPSLDYPEKI